MRIIAGRWRGRPLVAPAGDATRPTADRTREALCSILVSRLGSFDGLAVADLFAGSGALGLEALSRGAASCLFVERDPAALAAIRENVGRLGAAGARVESGDAEHLTAGGPFDLVFLDPPYGTGAGERAAGDLLVRRRLAPGALLCLETAREEHPRVDGLDLLAARVSGRARLHLFRHDAIVDAETSRISGASSPLDG